MPDRLSVSAAAAIAWSELEDELAQLERLGLIERVLGDDEPRWAPTPAAERIESEAA